MYDMHVDYCGSSYIIFFCHIIIISGIRVVFLLKGNIIMLCQSPLVNAVKMPVIAYIASYTVILFYLLTLYLALSPILTMLPKYWQLSFLASTSNVNELFYIKCKIGKHVLPACAPLIIALMQIKYVLIISILMLLHLEAIKSVSVLLLKTVSEASFQNIFFA